MLIYNFQKEFLGIDEKDLRILGFHSLEELRKEVIDFADLFVKTPGYIHNFKHIHWIDFIQYSDESEEAKVLINIHSKTFSATLKLSTLFLIDNPAVPAYIVHLQNLHPLSKDESNNLSNEILDRELPKVEVQQTKTFPTTISESEIKTPPAINDTYDTENTALQEYNSPSTIDTPLEINFDEPLEEQSQKPTEISSPVNSDTEMLTLSDISLDVFEDDPGENQKEQSFESFKNKLPISEKEKNEIQDTNSTYQYDPNIASKELGLPIDLIEEFIQDFIIQAKDFHDEIYTAINQNDIEKVKTLSHKLKGVAANLRIEDAHEVLSAVSASSEMPIIHENINTFYAIIAKLSGESVPTTDTFTHSKSNTTVEEESTNLQLKDNIENDTSPKTNDKQTSDDIIEIDFKEDDDLDMPLEVKDEDVPDKIEILELADDNFFEDVTNNDIIHNNESKISIYSKADAAAEIGIDQKSFNELFEDFVEESHLIFQRITEAIKNDDFESCRNEAIKFKGMSDNMRLHEFTDELETLIYSSNKERIIQAAEKIDITIKKISQMGE